jgi:Zn-dependent protease with chaperone function
MDTQSTPVPWPALGLYAATLALEWFVVCWRGFVLLMGVGLPLAILSRGSIDANTLFVIAYAPMVWSIIALSRTVGWMGTGQWWRTRVGGREPTSAERAAYNEAMQILEGRAPGGQLHIPKDWFVMDLAEPEAAVCGQTLMLSRGMLESPYLPAVLAHELGHLATWDARLTAAINRLIIHPLKEPHPDQERYEQQTKVVIGTDPVTQVIGILQMVLWVLKTALRWCRGGIGLWLLKPFWGNQWRESEYTADQYAARLGQGDDLAEFLEINALAYDRPVPLTWLAAYTHPPTALRIDRLRAPTHQPVAQQPIYPVSETNLGRPALQEELPGLGAHTA